ncbi:MAG: AAA family ATPase [Pseudomonadota bacterium]|nr:AAA family ATPase [Pseudomonadota bacterium]
MYLEYFGLTKLPFTISPDPDFLYPSPGHQEALAHLSYALTDQGGLICLTGEVGTGKTTLCRALMESVPEGDHIAYIFNPQLSPLELMQSLCDDLRIAYPEDASLRELYSVINQALLDFYSRHQRVICVIDEAQAMPPALLEQIRLLTNLETHREKLLTLVLVGQPELRDVLARHDLRQLNQRITTRYHLNLLTRDQVAAYLNHRLSCAGSEVALFDAQAITDIWRASEGTPRLINSIADRALLGAYATESTHVTRAIARQAITEVLGEPYKPAKSRRPHQLGQSSRGVQLVAENPWWIKAAMVAGFFMVAVMVGWLFSATNTSSSDSTLTSGLSAMQGAVKEALRSVDETDPNQVLADSLGIQGDPCDEAGAVCVRSDWAISELKAIGQNSVVRLLDGRWQALAEYQGGYAGEALVHWRPPVSYQSPLKPGQTSPVVRWVRSELGITWNQDWTSIGPGGVTVAADPDFYDPLLEQAVAEFQITQGLKADRIIGPKTLMYLQASAE